MIDSEEDPFTQYHISNKWKLLENIKERSPCPKCAKSRKYFCYTCYIPIPCVRNIIPQVQLPIKIDIIKHRREIDGKSTSAHAAILAPEDVSIYNFPDEIPNFPLDSNTVVIYPGKKSKSVKEYFQDNSIEVYAKTYVASNYKEYGKLVVGENILKLPFNRAVFIDGTWNQSKGMYNCLQGLPSIVLQTRVSQFWRHQKNSPRWYLATIEAIHQWLNEIQEQCSNTVCVPFDRHRYDDLLFFFRHMYEMIHSFYDHNALLSYRRPINL